MRPSGELVVDGVASALCCCVMLCGVATYNTAAAAVVL